MRISHLKALEAEHPYLPRGRFGVSATVLLYSIGKDSSVMLRLAQKAS